MALDFEDINEQSIQLGTALVSLQNVAGATLMCWAIPEVTAIEQFLMRFSINGSATNSRAHISRLANDAWRAGGRRTDLDLFSSADSAANTALTGTLYHVCARLDYVNGTLQLFINGVLVTNTNVLLWNGNSSNTTSAAASLGEANNGANFYDGIMDDARVYNRALSAQEIQNIYYSRGKDSNVLGLVHRWTFREDSSGDAATGAGSTKDKGTGVLNGTPSNSPVFTGCLVSHRRRRRR